MKTVDKDGRNVDLDKARKMYHYTNANLLSSLNILVFGYDRCTDKSPQIGPTTSWFYSIHYVLSGKGTYCIGSKEYSLKAKDMFFVPPYTEVKYYPDKDDPFEYAWIAFDGANAQTLCQTVDLFINPVFSKLPEVFFKNVRQLSENVFNPVARECQCLSILFETFFYIANDRMTSSYKDNPKKVYVDRTVEYINQHYMDCDLRTSRISEEINVSSNYLSTLFKEQTGKTVSQFILLIRIQKACEYLEHGYTNIQFVADQTGFSDCHYFSRAFKKLVGVSPTKYLPKADIEA